VRGRLLTTGLLVTTPLLHRLVRDLRTVPRAAVRRAGAPSVSVVVPARDEAATLPTLLRSLRRLTVPVAEVVVVDDASRDATAAVARDAGATVVPVEGPPAGWTGKAWACHVGARATSGELLLFLDADTELAPDALDGLLALHDAHGGLVSVQPFHEVRRPYEHLSSYFNVVSLLASGAFGPGSQRRPLAFGPCLVTSRADYGRAGGHAAVRGEILDDVQLAAAYRRAGLPVTCAVGGESVRMRMYPGGVRQLAEGWTKNFASGASAGAAGPTAAAVAWVAAHHAVAAGTGRALIRAVTGRAATRASGHPALWLLAWAAVSWQLRSVLRRIGSFRWWTWALFPAPLLGFDVLFARSAALTLVRRSVRWRGREVPLTRPLADAAEEVPCSGS
jgi:4,4'-diaponeurosporenoate glycosyltransferase